jgi:amino acid transporter
LTTSQQRAANSERRAAISELPRELTLRDMVLFNVVAIVSLRWFATAAAAGPSSISLWILAALFFFIPQGIAVADLSARYPEEGGVYAWTKRAFGEGHGFLCGWCYWVNNILYYPNLLIATVVVGTYVIGRGGTELASQWTYVLPATLLALWFATWINMVGLRTGRWLQNIGAIGTYMPGLLLIGLGVYAALTRESATPLSLRALLPDFSALPELNLWASIAFAFAGVELCAVMGDEIHDPSRTLPRSIYISAPYIAFIYIVGTLAVLWLIPTKDVNIVSGFLQAIQAGARDLGWGVTWLPVAGAALYVLGNLGGVGAWLTGPARVAFVIGLDRYFPPAFGRIHPRWKTPYVVLIVQAVLATIFLFLSVLGKGTTVEKAYLVILDTMLLVYFIPYLYLFGCYLKDGEDGKHGNDGIRKGETVGEREGPVRRSRPLRLLTGISGITLTLFAMVVATVPPADTDPGLFRLKVIGGAAFFVILGLLIYWRGRR